MREESIKKLLEALSKDEEFNGVVFYDKNARRFYDMCDAVNAVFGGDHITFLEPSKTNRDTNVKVSSQYLN